jgi:Holliday junction resolvasome RuvABC endonuclease subunit
MNLLALDQSSKITGWALFEDSQLIDYGKFEAKDSNIIDRLNFIQGQVSDLIYKLKIDNVVIEDIQLHQSTNNNVVTYKTLAFVMASILLICHEINIPCEVVSAATWKSQCGVKGRARADQKRDAQRFVTETYDIKPTQDVVDAICLGHGYLKKAGSELNWA